MRAAVAPDRMTDSACATADLNRDVPKTIFLACSELWWDLCGILIDCQVAPVLKEMVRNRSPIQKSHCA